MTSKMTAVGDASLTGWRRKVGDPIARGVASRTRFSAEQVRAFLGFALIAITLYSLFKRARRVTRET
ncbi:MAG TPA: hypothetical protein VF097_01310 [Actinomycetota bacterium]